MGIRDPPHTHTHAHRFKLTLRLLWERFEGHLWKGDWGRSGYFTHHRSQPFTPQPETWKVQDIEQTCYDKLPALQQKKKKKNDNQKTSTIASIHSMFSVKDHMKLSAPLSGYSARSFIRTWVKEPQSLWVKDTVHTKSMYVSYGHVMQCNVAVLYSCLCLGV